MLEQLIEPVRKRIRYIVGAVKRTRLRVFFLLGDFLARQSTICARKSLREIGCPQILIDTSLFFHAVTHETAWIGTGTKLWGGIHPVETGYMARIPVHDRRADNRVYKEVCFLIPLAELAKQELVKLQTSAEIRAEIYRQPFGRFTGYGWNDLCVIHWADAPSIDGILIDLSDAREKQLERIHACQDERYRELLKLFPQKQSLDVFHIYTASKHGIRYFLHVDFALSETIRQNKNKEAFKSLGVEVMLPSEFGKRFGLIPVPPIVISDRASRFFVRPDLHRPNNVRQRPKRREA